VGPLKNHGFCVSAAWVTKRLAFLLIGLSAVWGSTVQAGLAEGVDAYKRRDYALALTEFLAAAQQGDVTAYRNLGVMYALGQGVVTDDRQAVGWFRLAADQGLAEAQLTAVDHRRVAL
jgi:TPR repeat protein